MYDKVKALDNNTVEPEKPPRGIKHTVDIL
jgi:hypothetical protein